MLEGGLHAAVQLRLHPTRFRPRGSAVGGDTGPDSWLRGRHVCVGLLDHFWAASVLRPSWVNQDGEFGHSQRQPQRARLAAVLGSCFLGLGQSGDEAAAVGAELRRLAYTCSQGSWCLFLSPGSQNTLLPVGGPRGPLSSLGTEFL